MCRAKDLEVAELVVQVLFTLCIPAAPISSNLTEEQLESLEVGYISTFYPIIYFFFVFDNCPVCQFWSGSGHRGYGGADHLCRLKLV